MLVLITGGSKNGKSHIAEAVITSYDLPRFYIATMEPFGEEAASAIKRHREIRSGKNFVTIEKYTDIQEISLPEKCAVLLECACNLCANEMFSKNVEDPVEKIMDGVKHLQSKAELLVIVTNQVGDDGMEYPKETMNYLKNMGKLNLQLAEAADYVIEAVYGVPVIWKGEKPECM